MQKIENQEYFNELKQLIIFKYIKENDLKKIMSLGEVVSFQPGEKIISKGEISPHLYAVLQGTVHVTVPEKGNKDVFICSIGKGDVFGEAGIFLKVKRTADVVSSDHVITFMVHREQIIDFIKSNPEVGIKILMLIIYSLLRKLKEANLEIAFERKADIKQSDIDSMVEEIMQN
ncbi:MAG: cyclic nucleotide-binding domain-containing protein [Spirochaetales bacterium]|nr:cyclic nucleotide-binding domain-containing protein [Spirochaetales bacterium]